MAGNSDIYFERRLRLWEWLPNAVRERAEANFDRLTGIRLRAGGAAQLVYHDGDELMGNLSRDEFTGIVSAMLGHSLYALQNQLAKGYFTLAGGARVGISGDLSSGGPRSVADISGVCIRIPRQIPGCADDLMRHILEAESALIVSPPGQGKTTMLRDISRQLSERGMCVCIIDERDEIAGCMNGIPAFDIGPRTDVISGALKSEAIIMALRSLAPDVIVADEIGGRGDAEVLHDALRLGVKVIASAHGDTLDTERMRPLLREVAKDIDLFVLLGGGAGNIRQICRRNGRNKDV